MLGNDIESLAFCTKRDVDSCVGGKERILRAVFIVSSGEGCSMKVDTGSIPAVIVIKTGNLTVDLTIVFGKVFVPGSCNHNLGQTFQGMNALRAIIPVVTTLGNGVDVGRARGTGSIDGVHGIKRNFIKDTIPSFIVIISESHILESQFNI